MKVLLATDGSPFSDAAVEEVVRRPWPEGGELRIISVVEPFVPPTADAWEIPSNYYEQMMEVAQKQAAEAVDKAAERLKSAAGEKPQITTAVISGHPKHAILEEAERWGADLIVVGSHGYRGLTKFLLGSVSQAIASHAKCSVEIVRSKETA